MLLKLHQCQWLKTENKNLSRSRTLIPLSCLDSGGQKVSRCWWWWRFSVRSRWMSASWLILALAVTGGSCSCICSCSCSGPCHLLLVPFWLVKLIGPKIIVSACNRINVNSCPILAPIPHFIQIKKKHGNWKSCYCTVGKMTRKLGIKFCLDFDPLLVLISFHRCLQSLTARNCNDKENSIGTRGRRKARILGVWSSGFESCLRHFFFLVLFSQIWMMTTTKKHQ